ncbi:MAG: (S)-ureidoglycine aminohydrolase [Johnsonella sp.]|nr:(S)-ureidoglycine aminohydrolase [Johnsonella sp.]
MSYLNNQIGYREDVLNTRSIVKKENYVLLEPDGLVKNTIPGFEHCDVTILGSPAMGATFVDYLVSVHEGGKHPGFGEEGIEVFLYVIEGELKVSNKDEEAHLTKGGYIFSPAGSKVAFSYAGTPDTKVYLYKRRYDKIEGYEAHTVVGNDKDLPWISYEGMENCYIKNFLPSTDNFGFDMNMHILKFHLGASHGYIETHIQQHGMYFLSGKAMYRLDGDWVPVKKGDYVFMDAYCPQACYGVGREEELTYIYSKDCNRDVRL